MPHSGEQISRKHNMPLSLMNQKLRVFVKKNQKESVQYNAELSITEVIEVLPEKRCINNIV